GGTIKLRGLHDRAQVWIDGVPAGVLTDGTAETGLQVSHPGGSVVLEILVENQGRINYGPLFGQGKGILGGVLVNQRYVFHWEQRTLDLDRPLDELLNLAGSAGAGAWAGTAAGPGWLHGEFEVREPADTHLALPGFGKGFAWINGFLLGRYWEVGPQVTLYVPAPLLRGGNNRLTVLELEHAGIQAELRETADLGAKGPAHIEDLG
ncbi:beta galactosidase jelly roll domain-containing protein, partial [Arthrobacter sp.]|uniref:beta galactosidase jelly roll domain-containing protein n=1 Tax=Arthrobacter sp. TaxID=1667 RepID=UPI002585EDCD